LAGAAGLRWTIGICFETAKDELGLDHCEARSWHAWHRHTSLVMAAAVFRAKPRADLLRAAMSDSPSDKSNERSPVDRRRFVNRLRNLSSLCLRSAICSRAPSSCGRQDESPGKDAPANTP
jgi:hypothetical protein